MALILAGAFSFRGAAQTIPPDPETLDRRSVTRTVSDSLHSWWRWSDGQMRGISDLFTPDTQERRTWRLTLEPHFGDLVHREHFRIPIGAIYGFNDHAEGSFEVDTYVPNVFRDGAGSGVSNIRGGVKIAWKPNFLNMNSAAVGVNFVRPIPESPPYLNDGVNRYSTYLTFSRPNSRIQNLEEVVNLSYDFITPSRATGTIPHDKPQNDFVKISPGLLYRKDDVTYGLAFSWARTVDGPTEHFFTLTPSIVLMVPERFTFESPGEWQLGAALESKFYHGETDFSFRVRVRWYVDYRTAWKEWRDNRRAARDERLAEKHRARLAAPPRGP
jgi:hypothetical protein